MRAWALHQMSRSLVSLNAPIVVFSCVVSFLQRCGGFVYGDSIPDATGTDAFWLRHVAPGHQFVECRRGYADVCGGLNVAEAARWARWGQRTSFCLGALIAEGYQRVVGFGFAKNKFGLNGIFPTT